MLSYLANHFASMSGTKSTFATVLEYGASIIALVAIFKSFFGHYLGTLEGLNGLILKFGYKGDKKKVSVGKLNKMLISRIICTERELVQTILEMTVFYENYLR